MDPLWCNLSPAENDRDGRRAKTSFPSSREPLLLRLSVLKLRLLRLSLRPLSWSFWSWFSLAAAASTKSMSPVEDEVADSSVVVDDPDVEPSKEG